MDTIALNLTQEEKKKIKDDFQNGQVYTDGCFCGHFTSNFRDNLHLVIDFSCRKSMNCKNPYYQVTDVSITEKAADVCNEQKMAELVETIHEFDAEDVILATEGRKFTLVNSYDAEPTTEDIHFICEGLLLNEDSLRFVQENLFNYYKKTYGERSDATFKDIGYFNY